MSETATRHFDPPRSVDILFTTSYRSKIHKSMRLTDIEYSPETVAFNGEDGELLVVPYDQFQRAIDAPEVDQ